MLCELNGAFPAGLKVHHDEYKVENEGDVVLLYRQLDERKSGRSVGDIAWAYQGVVPELNAVPKGTAKLAAEGIAWYGQWQRSQLHQAMKSTRCSMKRFSIPSSPG